MIKSADTLEHALAKQREVTAVIASQAKPVMSQQEVADTLTDWEEHLARKAAVLARMR